MSKLQRKDTIVLIVGLGNPGKEYEDNRHNIGYMVCDQITKSQTSKIPTSLGLRGAGKSQNNFLKIKILKPDTFMNNSGEQVKKESAYYKIAPKSIFVVHDDMDLALGTVRISFGSSSAGHNGVQSIIDSLTTNEFWRIRVGIGRPPENIPPEKFVLQDFTAVEKENISGVIAKTAEYVLNCISQPKEETLQLL